MKLRESKEEEFPSSSVFVKPRNNRVERIRALYFIGDRGQFNKIPSGNIRTWNQAEGEKIHGGDQNKKKREREREAEMVLWNAEIRASSIRITAYGRF